MNSSPLQHAGLIGQHDHVVQLGYRWLDDVVVDVGGNSLENFRSVAHEHSQTASSATSTTQPFTSGDVARDGREFVGDLRELLVNT